MRYLNQRGVLVMRLAILVVLVLALLIGSPAWASLRSDGTSTQHLGGIGGGFSTAADFTLSVWFKPRVSGATNANSRFLMTALDNSEGDGAAFITDANGANIQAEVFDNNSVTDGPTNCLTSFTANKWYFFTIVRSGSNFSFYTGDESTATSLCVTHTQALRGTDAAWGVGLMGISSGGVSIDAEVMHWKHWTVALDSTQVEAERTSLRPSTTTNLFVYSGLATQGQYGPSGGGAGSYTWAEQGNTNFSTITDTAGPCPGTQICGTEPVAEYVNTANATTHSFGSFTPTPNAFLVAIFCARTTVATGSMANTSGTSLTWTKQTSGTFNAGADTVYIFTAPVPGSTAASVYSLDTTGDTSGGAIGYMWQFTNYDTSTPVAQVKTNSGTSTNPTTGTITAMSTNNAYAAMWCGGLSSSNPANVSAPPAAWVEVGDNGFATPTTNGSGAFGQTGETGTSVTFTAASSTWGLGFVEIKTAPAAAGGSTSKMSLMGVGK